MSPKDKSQTYPMLMTRTPYGIPPYEEDKYRFTLGPNREFRQGGLHLRLPGRARPLHVRRRLSRTCGRNCKRKGSRKDIDESTDTYDTIDWLVKNVPNNNGKVGMYGISYPGFYTSAGMIDAHPGAEGRVAAGADRRLVLRRLPPSRHVFPVACVSASSAASATRGPEPTHDAA